MKLLAILAVLALSPSTYASDYFENVSGIEFSADSTEKCFKFDSLRTYNCIQHFYTESQEALERTFKRISSEVKRDSTLLTDSQEKWLAFRKSECKLRAVSASAFQNPTAQGQLFFEACATELNNERVNKLNSIQLGCDSCLQ
ncbi:lysozyme inhibitor LprI family protein [Atopomonas sediminilitoris]|uniref:lysozyme inhibitor LprI family protein n=1 Tax=Atopomonas sediminilitoris TaxID=2919919 RepID=UPI001F4E7CC3|nr:lysozyme inhibitor LprI family protein [Atopomonas sediminilitoris]MCJ8170912.1 DUF1311 domain-containing protein [Atopomonas sediminilitoris]